jgi:RimJ/RimL family protein N-acetyltransferase
MELATPLPGCALRPWRPADRDNLVRHADNRLVWRNLTDTFPHPYTLQDADGWLASCAQPGRSVHLAITVDDAAVGGVGAIAGSGIGCAGADFGYWLGQAFWGRGIATAAARALADQLLGAGAFARLQAPVFAWNPASMRVLEKAGFVREGVLRHSVTKDGCLIDSVLYARTAA